MAEVLSFFANEEDGRKETVALGMGNQLAKSGKRVLLIDMDPNANLTNVLNFEDQEPNILDIFQKLVFEKEFDDHYAIFNISHRFDLLPSDRKLMLLEDLMQNLCDGESLLMRYISSINKKYDYVIINAPSSLNLFTINALAACDKVLIPIAVKPPFLTDYALTKLLDEIKRVQHILKKELPLIGMALLFEKKDLMTNKESIHEKIRQIFGKEVIIFDL